MIAINHSFVARRAPKLLAITGITLCLLMPITARAHHRDHDAVDILVGAAFAYALIDATGGFDDHRHHGRRYHSDRHSRYERSWRGHRRPGYHREYRRHHEHRRHHRQSRHSAWDRRRRH